MLAKQRRSRKQRGGSNGNNGEYSISHAFTTPGGVSIEGPVQSYSHCGWSGRDAPQMGGKRKHRGTKSKQHGGGCGCMAAPPMQSGGGSGSGGYGFVLNNEHMGKAYDSLSVGACASALKQTGGSGEGRSPYDIVSFPAGYGFNEKAVVSTNSAHYLEPVGYDRTCMGGGARKTKRKSKAHRKTKTKSKRKTQRNH